MASKRKRDMSPAPPQRSARLRTQQESASSGLPPRPTLQRELSIFSTDVETEETWPSLRKEAEARIANYTHQKRPNEDKLQASLNAFLQWLPEGGRESIARDIVGASTDDKLHEGFSNLLSALAMPMKTRSRPGTVTSSPHTRRLQSVEAVATTLDQPTERQRSFRNDCLRRDGYRCVISGELDINTWEARGLPTDVDFGPVEAGHIIPFSYASWPYSSVGPPCDHASPFIRTEKEPPSETSTAWEVLWRCFPGVRHEGIAVETINSLTNGLTMRSPVHMAFGAFSIALKPTDTPNLYERVFFRRYPSSERRALPASNMIELKQAPGAEDLELPSAALLDCHYRLAEILNASGMAEVIDEHWRRWEDLKESAGGMLRPDGGTEIGEYLEVALWDRVAV
ncbi:HNH endonuclease signature motif containing protein, partial [Aspergillus ibericus CBS 121593]